tara:strand:+ start:150 stop:440 length:291 start_codon:yes stop_codon:yes gene_type:complete
MAKINEDSEFTIPLKNLLSLVLATGIAVWAYFGIEERIAFLERAVEINFEEIEENDTWIDEFKPPKEVQDAIDRVRLLELDTIRLETKLERILERE